MLRSKRGNLEIFGAETISLPPRSRGAPTYCLVERGCKDRPQQLFKEIDWSFMEPHGIMQEPSRSIIITSWKYKRISNTLLRHRSSYAYQACVHARATTATSLPNLRDLFLMPRQSYTTSLCHQDVSSKTAALCHQYHCSRQVIENKHREQKKYCAGNVVVSVCQRKSHANLVFL